MHIFLVVGATLSVLAAQANEHMVSNGGVRIEQAQTMDKSGMIQVQPGVWIRSDSPTNNPVVDRSKILQMPQVLDSDGLEHAHRWYEWVFVMFTAPSCKYCRKIAPEFQAVAQQWDGHMQIRVVKVDCTTTGVSICNWLKIDRFPKFRLFVKDVSMKMAIEYPQGMERTAALFAGFLQHHTRTEPPDVSWIRGPDYVLRPPKSGWRALQKHRRLKKMRSIHCSICATLMRDLWHGTRYLAQEEGMLGREMPSGWRMGSAATHKGEASDEVVEAAFEKMCERPARRLQRMSLDLESRALALQIPGTGEADVPWINAANQSVTFRSFDYRFACERLVGEFDDDIIRALKTTDSLPKFVTRICSAAHSGACHELELHRLNHYYQAKENRFNKIQSTKAEMGGLQTEVSPLAEALAAVDETGVELNDEELEEFDEGDTNGNTLSHEEL